MSGSKPSRQPMRKLMATFAIAERFLQRWGKIWQKCRGRLLKFQPCRHKLPVLLLLLRNLLGEVLHRVRPQQPHLGEGQVLQDLCDLPGVLHAFGLEV